MSKPKDAHDLARQIESLIADFLEGHRAAASAAALLAARLRALL
jgi:hypothetical protein